METSDLTTYPIVAKTDYPPTNESFSYPDTFDKAYLADFYTTSLDHSLDTFLAVFNGANTSPNTMNAFRPAFSLAPFGQLEQSFAPGFLFNLPGSFELRRTNDNSKTNTINTRYPSPIPSL